MCLVLWVVSEVSFYYILVFVKVCDILFKIVDGIGGKWLVVDGMWVSDFIVVRWYCVFVVC